MNAMGFTELLGLHPDDIYLEVFLEDFGKMPDLYDDETQSAYLEYKEHGFCIMFKELIFILEDLPERREDQLVVNTIMLFAHKHENYKQFQGNLPFNIKFSNSRDEIRTKIGFPVISGGGAKNTFIGGIWPEWDQYIQDNYTISFHYKDDHNSVNVVMIRNQEKSD